MSLSPDPRQTLFRLIDGYLITQLIAVATSLGVPDLLATGPATAADLAERTGAESGALHRVLRGLATEGVVTEEPDGHFASTPMLDLLRTGAPGSMRGAASIRGNLYYRAASGLLDAVRTGGRAFDHAFGTEFFDHLRQQPALMSQFQQSMVSRSTQEAHDVVSSYDATRFRRVVDIGGGTGILLRALLAANPTMTGVLFDQPDVIAGARELLAGTEVADRVSFAPGDFFASVPEDADLYVLSRVLHDWDDEAAIRILTTCRAAMSPDATLVLVDAVLPERAVDAPAAVRMDLHMLVLLPGRERTAEEFTALLERAGFGGVRIVPTRSAVGLHVIEARPAG